ncbi:MAG: peptidylprolyl isomerase [Bacteroidaceae bacterium]|nr:peptidylprolyl isomerase [Bacteroidaceae bacterium]
MKRYVSTFMVLAVSLCVAAQEDPVVMTVAGMDVTRSEFEYFLNKNRNERQIDEKTVAEYADMYVNFKLKVAEAMSEGMDTLPSFLEEYKSYRGAEAEKYLIDEDWLDREARQIFQATQDEVGEQGLYDVGMITIYPKNDKEESILAARAKIDSLRLLIENGADFSEVAAKYSQDAAARDGGRLGWTAPRQMPFIISDAVFSLENGELSQPFFSEYGWNLFKIFGVRLFDYFENYRHSILEWLLENGYYETSKLQKAERLAKKEGWGEMTREEALAYEDAHLEEMYPEFRLLSQEYHDGLLLFDISNREVWEKVTKDTVMLEKWFAKHRKEYVYDKDKPQFKGVLVFSKDEETFQELKGLLEGLSDDEMVEKVTEFNADSVKVRILPGPFRKGASSFCDKIVFKDGECVPVKDFPVMNYVGRILTGPESWTDVPGSVISECQASVEKDWVKKLRKKYKYTIYKSALATVGKHD